MPRGPNRRFGAGQSFAHVFGLSGIAAVCEAEGRATRVLRELSAKLLLGTDVSGVSIVIGRIAGIALLSLGVGCWLGRQEAGGGWALAAMLLYNILATAYLAYVGIATEFVLFGRRGSLPTMSKVGRNWWQWKRPYDERGKPQHSAKPEEFYAMVEQVSPGPYLDMFARRPRLGWDVWGDEAPGSVDLPA